MKTPSKTTGKARGGAKSENGKLHVDREGNLYNEYEVLTDEELKWMNMVAVSPRMEDNKRALEEQFGLNTSFDVKFREMTFGEKATGLLYLNGFAKDEVLTMIQMRLSMLDKGELVPRALAKLFEKYIPHIQVELVSTIPDAILKVMMGGSALFIEGEEQAIVMDVKQYPVRSIEEPSLERVVRGSRDGFTETLLTNVTLVRRRLRDPRLKFEVTMVGERSKTEVCIAYINDIADLDLVENVKDKIRKVKIDGIPLADKQLEEIIIGKNWNPYPQVRYSERPDVIASHLLEGHIVVFVDTSPSVMILPTTFFHLVQHAEEYRQTPFMGTYLRWVRFFGIFVSLFLLPAWLLFVMEPQLLPRSLDFIGPAEKADIPLFGQILVAEFGIDLMRLAAVHTPTPLATAMGLIAAVLIGEIAVKVGLFVNEVILYISLAALGMFATPNYELSMANRVVRLLLLVAVALFKAPGLIAGSTLVIILLAVQRSFHSPYLWPFIPFDAKAFFTLFIRIPTGRKLYRPSLLKTADSTRKPS
jgi:Bacillus/Clostridium GerA spore germination protein.